MYTIKSCFENKCFLLGITLTYCYCKKICLDSKGLRRKALTDISISRKLRLAHQHSNNANYGESASCFYQAAMIAEKDLKDHFLCKKYLFYNHIENLKSSRGKSIPDIDSIIHLLKEMSSMEDDRFLDRLAPVIDFFTILKYCLMDEVQKVRATLEDIRKRTEDESISQIQSVTHLLCESVLVKQTLKACRSKIDGSFEHVFNPTTILSNKLS